MVLLNIAPIVHQSLWGEVIISIERTAQQDRHNPALQELGV